jgi:hypothetical protein
MGASWKHAEGDHPYGAKVFHEFDSAGMSGWDGGIALGSITGETGDCNEILMRGIIIYSVHLSV